MRTVPELLVPYDSKSRNGCLGLILYYSQWIHECLDRVKPITKRKSFPLSHEGVEAFKSLKKTVEKAFITVIDESVPFDVETASSDVALSSHSQLEGRTCNILLANPTGSELKHASVEKESQAIIEAVRHWKHFLTEMHFTLTTDQKTNAIRKDYERQNHAQATLVYIGEDMRMTDRRTGANPFFFSTSGPLQGKRMLLKKAPRL